MEETIMIVRNFTDTVIYEFNQCKTEEDVEYVTEQLINLIKAYELLAINNINKEN